MLNLNLNYQQVFGTENAVPLCAVHDWLEYIDGKQGKRLGSSYQVIMLNNQCTVLTVKVEDATAIITQDELDKRNISANFLMVKFDGFVAKPYSDRNGQMQLSAKADKIIVLSNNSGTGAAK